MVGGDPPYPHSSLVNRFSMFNPTDYRIFLFFFSEGGGWGGAIAAKRWRWAGGVASGFRILAIVPVRSGRKNTSVEPAANHGRPASVTAPPTTLYIKRGRPPPLLLAIQRYLRVVSSPSRTPDYFTLSFEPSFILSRSNNGRHAGRRRHRDLCQGRTPSLISHPAEPHPSEPNAVVALPKSNRRREVGRRVMDRPMRGGFF